MTCSRKDRGPLRDFQSEGFHSDVLPSLQGLVSISGTNRQHTWHRHRNMALKMDAANEGPPVLIQPDMSITGVIIYYLHLLSSPTQIHLNTNKKMCRRPAAGLSLHPSQTPTLFFAKQWQVQAKVPAPQHRLLWCSCEHAMTISAAAEGKQNRKWSMTTLLLRLSKDKKSQLVLITANGWLSHEPALYKLTKLTQSLSILWFVITCC